MASGITHKGTITHVGDGHITVNFNPGESDCSGCAIARICHKGESMEIPYPDAFPSLKGRRVEFTINNTAGRLGVLLLLVIPIVLLIGVMALALWLGASEGTAALTAIASMALWLSAVYLTQRRWKAKSPFTVKLLD